MNERPHEGTLICSLELGSEEERATEERRTPQGGCVASEAAAEPKY